MAILSCAACAERAEVVGEASAGLVFARMQDGAIDLARARLSDGEILPLTRTPDADETWPYWSGHAERLVFQRARAGHRDESDLWLWKATGGARPLTRTPHRSERWPAWSPSRPELVFAFRGGRPAAGIAHTSLDGTIRVIARATPPETFLRPSFAPDGRRLVVQRRLGPGGGSALWLLEPGADARALTTGEWFDLKAWFTRDGRRIVFTRRPIQGARHHIASIDVSGDDLHEHVPSPGDHHSARPSPTRDEIAFVSDREGGSDVFLADLAGGAVRNLTHTTELAEFAPRWSPDGERLVVTANAGAGPKLRERDSLEQTRIRVLDREGRVLFDAPGFMADWMPPW